VTWLLAAIAALAAFGAIVLLKAPRKGWEAIGAALLVGLAGYAMQANPGLAGKPTASVEPAAADPSAALPARRGLAGEEGLSGNNWVLIADAMARHGRFGDAAGVLLGAVDAQPNNGEAWLALANALVGHAEGTLTPAALYAYQHAAAAAPGHPGPPFFLGMALANSGRFEEARQVWSRLLSATPADAPWRGDLAERLARLEAFIQSREGAAPRPGPAQ
jgi:cytochrome c-type biogenesis protein CcmH